MIAMGTSVSTGSGLLRNKIEFTSNEDAQSARRQQIDRMTALHNDNSRAGLEAKGVIVLEKGDLSIGSNGLPHFSDAFIQRMEGKLVPQNRTDAMWHAFDKMGDVKQQIGVVNESLRGSAYASARLNGTLTEDQQNFRVYLPNGEIFYQEHLTMGVEMTDEQRSSVQGKLSHEKGTLASALKQLEQLTEYLGNSFKIEGELARKNGDGTLSLGAFKLVHEDYGVMMTSDGEGNVTMFDEAGKGSDPLSYMKQNEGLRSRYLATTVDIRF